MTFFLVFVLVFENYSRRVIVELLVIAFVSEVYIGVAVSRDEKSIQTEVSQ